MASAAFVLYPRPTPTSTVVQCGFTRWAVFPLETESGTSFVTVNATETTVTSYTTVTTSSDHPGAVVTTYTTYSNISALEPGMYYAGNITECTYLSSTLSVSSNSS